jgi:hypothetical protein
MPRAAGLVALAGLAATVETTRAAPVEATNEGGIGMEVAGSCPDATLPFEGGWKAELLRFDPRSDAADNHTRGGGSRN